MRIVTRDGYVTPADLKAVNKLLDAQGYEIGARGIQPFASGPEQMFNVIRSKQSDVAFLILNYVKMRGKRTTRRLQVINTGRPGFPIIARVGVRPVSRWQHGLDG